MTLKTKTVVIKFHGSKSVNGVMELVLKDARDAVRMAGSSLELNRQVLLELKELVAIAENNQIHLLNTNSH